MAQAEIAQNATMQKPGFLAALRRGLRSAYVTMVTARAGMIRYHYLNRLSDEELAKFGFRRDRVLAEAMRDTAA